MSPRILLSASTPSADTYEDAVRAAGGVPFTRQCPGAEGDFDGLILCGGGDLDPALYGQEDRGSQPPDRARGPGGAGPGPGLSGDGAARPGHLPGRPGPQRGPGGHPDQDLGPLDPFHVWEEGDKVHPVAARPGSLLSALYGPLFPVNSAHHQAVDRPGEGLVITARSEGGVAEALELPGRPVLGVQFHPERMTAARRRPDTVDGAPIFRWLMEQCRRKG